MFNLYQHKRRSKSIPHLSTTKQCNKAKRDEMARKFTQRIAKSVFYNPLPSPIKKVTPAKS